MESACGSQIAQMTSASTSGETYRETSSRSALAIRRAERAASSGDLSLKIAGSHWRLARANSGLPSRQLFPKTLAHLGPNLFLARVWACGRKCSIEVR
jgi:hypothetical protein